MIHSTDPNDRGDRFQLRQLAGMPDWSELVAIGLDLAERVIAYVHDRCGSTRSQVIHNADGTSTHTCIDCALDRARDAKES